MGDQRAAPFVQRAAPFETLTPDNLRRSGKRQNLGRDYSAVAARCVKLAVSRRPGRQPRSRIATSTAANAI